MPMRLDGKIVADLFELPVSDVGHWSNSSGDNKVELSLGSSRRIEFLSCYRAPYIN